MINAVLTLSSFWLVTLGLPATVAEPVPSAAPAILKPIPVRLKVEVEVILQVTKEVHVQVNVDVDIEAEVQVNIRAEL